MNGGQMGKGKLKILEVLLVPIAFGGIERFINEIVDRLEPDVSIDCLTTRCCVDEDFKKRVEKRGGALYELNTPKRLTRINMYRAIRRFLSENEIIYDIIHIHASGIEELCIAAAACDYSEKTTVIGHNHTVASMRFLMPLVYLLRFSASFSMRRHIDRYCACSTQAASWVFMPKYRRQAQIIHNGVDTDKFRFDTARRSKTRQMLNIPPDDFVIGNVGRLHSCKNQEFLIRVFAEVQHRKPDSRLILVGDGADRKKLELLAKEKAVDHKVVFAGDTPDVPDYLTAMDVFAFPSRNEGFGIAAVEAQASGLPVIASDRLPVDVKMTENFRFLSIENSISEWTAAILSAKSVEREKGADAVKEAGYDIEYTMGQIRQLYGISALEKGN